MGKNYRLIVTIMRLAVIVEYKNSDDPFTVL